MDIKVWPPDVLDWQGRQFRCAVGRGSIGVKTREGDGITPIGAFPLRRVHYRPDRLERPRSGLPIRELRPADGWCDEPEDPAYNRLVELPHPASHEKLWRDDAIYDVIVEIGYNDAPLVPGLGSAIFLHVARTDYAPTEGCVALALDDLLEVVEGCCPSTLIRITPGPA